MSEKYVSNNLEGTLATVYKKAYYSAAVSPVSQNYKNLVNFHFAEKMLYGRVDRANVPMRIQSPSLVLKDIPAKNAAGETIQAVSFVVDAFSDLVRQFQKSVVANKISSTEPYLSSLKAYKAYENPIRAYASQRQALMGAMRIYYANENIRFDDFDSFLPQFMTDLEATVYNTPYTYPAFIKSRKCPINVSGLVIEIADLDASNDDEKINAFMENKNWSFFLNACRSYGFLVDQNKPWRLVADLGSREMLRYANKYGFESTTSILAGLYMPVYARYYDRFKISLLEAYNELKQEEYVVREYCQSGRTVSRLIEPRRYKPADFLGIYSEEMFMKLYFQIRFMEEESSFSPEERQRIIDECLDLFRAQGSPHQALGIFALLINKPYDYKGSLTDYFNRAIVVPTE
tara:strand:+ start:3387 stop:4595 length:1209 start_codon:yes stop_codon:yes gene_type:complete